jgi:hypothetical protein
MIRRVPCPIRLSPRYRQGRRKGRRRPSLRRRDALTEIWLTREGLSHTELGNVLPTESTSCRRGVALRNDKGGRRRPPSAPSPPQPVRPNDGILAPQTGTVVSASDLDAIRSGVYPRSAWKILRSEMIASTQRRMRVPTPDPRAAVPGEDL